MSYDSVNASDDEGSSDNKMNKTLLNSMYRRRMSCPMSVQRLWDAVKVTRYQRQVPNSERVAKYMSRIHSTSPEEVNRQVNYCLRDGLLQIIKKKGNKGSKQGVEQEGYKLPDAPERDKHDWYCFECHTGGDVIFCSGCHRVYHVSCINNVTGTKAKYLCTVCLSTERPETLRVGTDRLNRLALMTCNILKDRYSNLVNSTEMLQRPIFIGAPGAQLDIGDETWRIKYLLHKNMDISRMASKARERRYTHLGQVVADARTIVHNVVIFHGVHSDMADDARSMLRDTETEVAEMRACRQCYKSARTKARHWFCRPCQPPHSLLWAPRPAHPAPAYWPAKVLSVQGDKMEVRYFGGNHDRSTVNKNSTLPITTNQSSLQSGRSPTWTKACDELRRHQDLMSKGPPSESSSSSSEDEGSRRRKEIKPRSRSTSEESIPTPPEPVPLDIHQSDSEPETTPVAETDYTRNPRLRGRKRLDYDEESANESSESDKPLAKRQSLAVNRGRGSLRGRPVAGRKRRGRPPKVKTDEVTPPPVETPPAEPPPTTPPASTASTSSTPRKRGRPPGSTKKKKEEVETVKPSEEEKEEDKKPIKLDEEEEDANEEAKREEEEEEPSETVKEEEDIKPELEEVKEGNSSTAGQEVPTSSTRYDAKREEEVVSSSCTEPQFRSIATQTKHYSSLVHREIEELKEAHAEQIKQLQESHIQEMSLTKKKQWCYSCEQEAIYHCCWNTAYCSTHCQQVHWQQEHKRVCRRKR